MSRLIQFRVRDKQGKLIGYNRFNQGHWQCQMVSGGSGEWSSGVLHGAIIEQYTGLTDKVGRDIYASDIVAMFSGSQYSEVFYDDGCWWVYARESGVQPAAELSALANVTSTCEVVGNIHDNADL